MQNILSVIAANLVITTNNLNEAMKALEKGYEVLFGGNLGEDTCVGKFLDEDTFVFAWGLECNPHPIYTVRRDNTDAWKRLMLLLESTLFCGDNYWNVAHLIQHGWVCGNCEPDYYRVNGTQYKAGFLVDENSILDPRIVSYVGGKDVTQELVDELNSRIIKIKSELDFVTPYMEEAPEEWVHNNPNCVEMEIDRLHAEEWEEAYNRVYDTL